MPAVRKIVVAICCSDIHLSLKAPLARSGEPDWLEAQGRPMSQLHDLVDEYDVPIFCAGDIFDRWNSPPELINWAIVTLPKMYAIPGQHDLPLHNMSHIKKSAYWTLVEAGILEPLSGRKIISGSKIIAVHAFPWGFPIQPPEENHPDTITMAVIHRYVWKKGHSYPTAPEENRLGAFRKELKGYDVAIFGDNHKGFLARAGKTTVFNCGGFMRRKSDEIDYKPQVGLLYDDGSIEPHYLDCSADIITETASAKTVEDDMELKDFLEELTRLQDSSLDFEDAMKEALEKKKPKPAVKKLILEAME